MMAGRAQMPQPTMGLGGMRAPTSSASSLASGVGIKTPRPVRPIVGSAQAAQAGQAAALPMPIPRIIRQPVQPVEPVAEVQPEPQMIPEPQTPVEKAIQETSAEAIDEEITLETNIEDVKTAILRPVHKLEPKQTSSTITPVAAVLTPIVVEEIEEVQETPVAEEIPEVEDVEVIEQVEEIPVVEEVEQQSAISDALDTISSPIAAVTDAPVTTLEPAVAESLEVISAQPEAVSGPPATMSGPPATMSGPPATMSGPPATMSGPPATLNPVTTLTPVSTATLNPVTTLTPVSESSEDEDED